MQRHRYLLPWGLTYLVVQVLLVAQFDEPWRAFVFPSANFLAVAFGLEFFRPRPKWNGIKRLYASGRHAAASRMMIGLAVMSYAISIVLPFVRFV